MTFEEYQELYWSLMMSANGSLSSASYPRRDKMPDPTSGYVGTIFGCPLYVVGYKHDVFLDWAQRAANGEQQPAATD